MSIGLDPGSILALCQLVEHTLLLWKTTFGDDAEKVIYDISAMHRQLWRLHRDVTQSGSTAENRNYQYVSWILTECDKVVQNLRYLAEACSQKSAGIGTTLRNWERIQRQPDFKRTRNRLRELVVEMDEMSMPVASYSSWRDGRSTPREGDMDRKSFQKVHPSSISVAPYSRPSQTRNDGDPWEGKIVLCLDGGGVRGYASLLILEALVRAIAAREQELDPFTPDSYNSPLFHLADDDSTFQESLTDHSGKDSSRPQWDSFRLCHYFDYICGTSTGGIVAIMLSTMRCTIRETLEYNRDICRGLIPRFKRLAKTFPQVHSKTRNSQKMQSSLRHAFGDLDAPSDDESGQDRISKAFLASHPANMTMKTKSGRCQTLVFVSQNSGRGFLVPYAIRSYELPEVERRQRRVLNAEIDTTNISILDACRATSAAQHYFRKVRLGSVDGAFRDGSICTNNSAESVYDEIVKLHGDSPSPVQGLLSIGGVKAAKSRPGRTLALDGDGSRTPDGGDQFIRDHQQNSDLSYDRILCETSCEKSTNPEKMLGRIEREARQFCSSENVQRTLQKWAHYLVDARRRRCRSVQWATYAGLNITAETDPFESTEGRREIWQQWREYGGINIDDYDTENTE